MECNNSGQKHFNSLEVEYDFNKQELTSYKLLFSEIYIALNIQQEGGTFIIKMFDIFYHKTIQLFSFK